MGAFDHLTDADLDAFRKELKLKKSGSRLKNKPNQVFLEQQFELTAASDESRQFRLYRRHHPELDHVFSVGLAVCLGAEWLTLCRYNGSYHAHRNHLERNRLVGVCHMHTATARYIAEAAHPDGFAVETDKYSTIDGAFRSMLIDCNISGILPDGDSAPDTLDFGF